MGELDHGTLFSDHRISGGGMCAVMFRFNCFLDCLLNSLPLIASYRSCYDTLVLV